MNDLDWKLVIGHSWSLGIGSLVIHFIISSRLTNAPLSSHLFCQSENCQCSEGKLFCSGDPARFWGRCEPALFLRSGSVSILPSLPFLHADRLAVPGLRRLAGCAPPAARRHCSGFSSESAAGGLVARCSAAGAGLANESVERSGLAAPTTTAFLAMAAFSGSACVCGRTKPAFLS